MNTLGQASLSGFLPSGFGKWKVGQERIYNPSDLYDYIDGAAELYISYCFTQVISRIYSQKNIPDVRVDLFDMGNSFNAYGVFSQTRDKDQHQFGQGSQLFRDALLFWKDKFFISLSSENETPDVNSAILELASYIDKAIPGTGHLPDILNLLPADSLDLNQCIFFYNHIWQNSYCFISNDNLLDIRLGVEAVLAKYRLSDETPILLVVLYPGSEEASGAYSRFIKAFASNLNQKNNTIKSADGTWFGCAFGNRIFLAVFKCHNQSTVIRFLEQTDQLPGPEIKH